MISFILYILGMIAMGCLQHAGEGLFSGSVADIVIRWLTIPLWPIIIVLVVCILVIGTLKTGRE